MINVANYLKVLAALKAHPENWDQRFWTGSTKYCFAGFASNLAHFPPHSAHDDGVVAKKACEYLGIQEYGAWDEYLFHVRRTIEDFEEVAQRLQRGIMVPPLTFD